MCSAPGSARRPIVVGRHRRDRHREHRLVPVDRPATGLEGRLPEPEERRLIWFVREPWPSVTTGTDLDFGRLRKGDELVVTSELGEDGVIFADGIESDWVEFLDGQTGADLPRPRRAALVVPSNPRPESRRCRASRSGCSLPADSHHTAGGPPPRFRRPPGSVRFSSEGRWPYCSCR